MTFIGLCAAEGSVGGVSFSTSDSSGTSSPRVLRVVADVDTGIDDALALAFLAVQHRQSAVKLLVTTAAGNCSAVDAARNSAEILRAVLSPDSFSGRQSAHPKLPHYSVAVVAGAPAPRVLPLETTPETHGPRGLGHWNPEPGAGASAVALAAPDQAGETGEADRVEPSAERAVAAWRAHRPTHLLVCGPATNLAYAVEHHPEVLAGCQVAIMAGAFGYPGNTTPTAEWNAWVDPHALHYALVNWPGNAPKPLIVPLNVTEQVLLTPDRLNQWLDTLGGVQAGTASGAPGAAPGVVPGDATGNAPGATQDTAPGAALASILEPAVRFYFEFHEKVGVGYQAQIHDLAAAMVLLDEALTLQLEWSATEYHVAVEADSPLTRGTTLAFDPHPPVTPDDGPLAIVREATARVVDRLEPGGVLKKMGEKLATVNMDDRGAAEN